MTGRDNTRDGINPIPTDRSEQWKGRRSIHLLLLVVAEVPGANVDEQQKSTTEDTRKQSGQYEIACTWNRKRTVYVHN